MRKRKQIEQMLYHELYMSLGEQFKKELHNHSRSKLEKLLWNKLWNQFYMELESTVSEQLREMCYEEV